MARTRFALIAILGLLASGLLGLTESSVGLAAPQSGTRALAAQANAQAHASRRAHVKRTHPKPARSKRTRAKGTHATRTHTKQTRAKPKGCTSANLLPTHRNLRLIRVAVMCLVNRERTAHGEHALHANPHLERAAQDHTEEMAFGNFMGHFGLDGDTPLARIREAGYIYSPHLGFEVGENVAWGTLRLATPRSIVEGWLASPGHRANILDPRFRDTAIGVSPHPPSSLAHGQRGAIYTQDFGRLLKA